MFLKKSNAEIIQEALDYIVENTPFTNLTAGSIARSIVEAVSKEYETLYEFAEDVLNQGFLSKAKEQYLDLFGIMFNYPRRNEIIINSETGAYEERKIDDETYRYELSKRVETAVSSNEESLRLAALTQAGVQDIKLKEYTHGAGSFSLILTTQYGFDPETVKMNIEESIQKTKGFGVRAEVILPKDINLDMKIQVSIKDEGDDDLVKRKLKEDLMNYFGNFGTGEHFVYNQLVEKIMTSDKNIIDFDIISFYLNDTPVLLTNHTILDEERIRPKNIDVI